MKRIFIYLILCGVAWGEQSIEGLCQTLLNDFDKRDSASIIVPEEIKVDVINYVRDVRDDKIYGNHVSARTLLVNLNDQEHIQQLFADLQQSENPMAARRAASALRRSSQAEVIPMLADWLYGDNDIYRDGKLQEIMLASLSIHSGSITMNILSRSPDVPADVRERAKAILLEKKNGPSRREVMRKWWPENKQHFETKEYDKLRPLGVEHLVEEEIAEPVETQEEVAAPTVEETEEAGEPQSPAPEPPTAKPSGIWKYALISFALGLLAVFVIFRRKSK